MGRSNENPKKLILNGGQIYNNDEKTISLKMPPSKSKKYEIVEKGKEFPEGEVVIKLGNFKAEKDENGKIINVEYLSQQKEEVER